MLDGKATDALEASSLGFGSQITDIYSNCWGPKDDGKTFGKPGPLAAKSLKLGAEKVRYSFMLSGQLYHFDFQPMVCDECILCIAIFCVH